MKSGSNPMTGFWIRRGKFGYRHTEMRRSWEDAETDTHRAHSQMKMLESMLP